MGRPTKLTKELRERAVWAAGAGGSVRDIAAACRVSPQTLYNWLEGNVAFAMEYEEARAMARLRRLALLGDGDRSVDNRSVEAWLSRTSDDYRHVDRRVERDDLVDYDRLRTAMEGLFKDA